MVKRAIILTRVSWAKRSAMLVFVGIIAVIIFNINNLTGISDALRYFYYTLAILVLMFAYFEWFKDYSSTKSK